MAPDPVLEEQEEIALSNTDGDEELPEMSENFIEEVQEEARVAARLNAGLSGRAGVAPPIENLDEFITRMSQEFQKGKEKQEAAEVKKFKIKIGGRQFN